MQNQLEVCRVPLAELVRDPSNARVHSDRNIDAIKASLREFGQVSPLVVQAGTSRVIGGNGTLQAMGALGWTEADVVKVDLDDHRATALAIALNRTAELATWDMDTLGRLLEDLGDLDPETVGFSGEELDRILNRSLDLSSAPDAEEPGDIATPPDGEATHVKMVQLFYDEPTHAEFVAITDAAAETLGTDNLSDTILAVLKRVWNDREIWPQGN